MTPKPISEAEFTDSRSRKARGYAQSFETLGRIDQQIAGLWTDGIPMTELQKEYDETGKTTLESVRAAAQKHALAPKASFVLIGDYAKIGPGLKELNLGEVVLLDAEGKPVGSKQ